MRFGPYFAKLNAEFEHKEGEIVTESYQDPIGIWTGPGGLIENPDGTPVIEGQTWTEAQALEIYAEGKQDWAQAIWNMLNPKVRPQLKQHQFDAMGILAWNIGLGAFEDSSALELINAGRFEEAASSFLLWRRMTLRGKRNGPDGKPARDPDGNVMKEGQSWFKASRGIYRRSISAALLMVGRNWANAAASSKIILQSYPVKVAEGRWHDKITNEMDWKEILADAKDDPLPVIQGDPDPELFDLEPTKMERMSWESAKAVGADETLEEYVAHRRGLVKPMPVGNKPPSINTKQAEEVPYGIDPKKGGQPKEEAQRFVQAVKKEKGIEMKKMGERLAVAGTVAASANVASNEVRTFFESLGQIGYTLLAVSIVGGAIWWGVGKIREKYHANKEIEAEINATQWMY
jgi:lysozyme